VELDLRDSRRRRLFTVEIDPQHPPAVVKPKGMSHPQVSLNWDRAFDDEGHLRHCPACGCRDLYARRDFPQITGLALIVLAAVIAMVLTGMQMVEWAAAVFVLVLAVDVAIYFFARRVLVCYRCNSEYRKMPIRADHEGWSAGTNEPYRQMAEAAERAASRPSTARGATR